LKSVGGGVSGDKSALGNSSIQSEIAPLDEYIKNLFVVVAFQKYIGLYTLDGYLLGMNLV
jgi:hypothetical protein